MPQCCLGRCQPGRGGTESLESPLGDHSDAALIQSRGPAATDQSVRSKPDGMNRAPVELRDAPVEVTVTTQMSTSVLDRESLEVTSPRRTEALQTSILWVSLAAAIPAVLYFLYVFHFSVDVPFVDDWSVVPLVNSALHGSFSMSGLWTQWGPDRPVAPRLILLSFGLLDHLDERAVMLFNAGIFTATFVLLLSLFRSYVGRRLTFFSVLSLGILWFSLADIQNTLFGYQLIWYLMLFFVVAAAYFLLVPRHRRALAFAVALGSAVAGSLSCLQGFLVWPVGLMCLVWASPRLRRTYYESAIWLSTMLGTAAIFFHGYDFANTVCSPQGPRCSFSFGLRHPEKLERFLTLLVGNVVPTALWGTTPRYVGAQEVLGTAICLVAAFVVVQSIRERQVQPNPLPLLLIVFAGLFDVMIALGRMGEGLPTAGVDHYTMPNIILLVGIANLRVGTRPETSNGARTQRCS